MRRPPVVYKTSQEDKDALLTQAQRDARAAPLTRTRAQRQAAMERIIARRRSEAVERAHTPRRAA